MKCVWIAGVMYLRYDLSVFFFFQAEDGIRDLVRSRGLGDVYKRQRVRYTMNLVDALGQSIEVLNTQYIVIDGMTVYIAVSYTHLTLPTSDLV